MTLRTQAVAFSAAFIVLYVLAFAAIAHAQVVTTLSPGDSGVQVEELQRFLAQDSTLYPEALITGYYGSLTTAAVERFQCFYQIVCTGDAHATGFGRVGPVTLATIESQQSTSAAVPGVPNTGADNSAPVMTPATITLGATSATFSWITNKPTENAVLYASSWPFYLGSATSGWSKTFGTTAIVTLAGLIPNHTYYYVRQSVDANGNVQYDMGRSFTTLSR